MTQKQQAVSSVKVNGFPLWSLIVLIGGVVSTIIYFCIKHWRKKQNE